MKEGLTVRIDNNNISFCKVKAVRLVIQHDGTIRYRTIRQIIRKERKVRKISFKIHLINISGSFFVNLTQTIYYLTLYQMQSFFYIKLFLSITNTFFMFKLIIFILNHPSFKKKKKPNAPEFFSF